MTAEPTLADVLEAIQALGVRLVAVEKTGKDTARTVKRLDFRLQSMEATVNEVAVTVGVDSRGLGVMRAEVEDLDRRVKLLEDI